MEKSHLVHILRTLDKKEIREIKKWVASPAHNLRQDVMELLEYLVAGNRLHDDASLEKEKAFGAIYPGKTFNDAEMRQVIHFLLKAVEDFLVYYEFIKDEVKSKAILARVYRQRQLPKLFQKAIDAGKEVQRNQPYRNHQFLENEFIIQFEQYNYLSGLSRTVPYNLQEVSDSSDLIFMANKLRLSCLMIAHQAVFKSDYKMTFLNEVLTYIESNLEILKYPAVATYYYGYKALTDQDDVGFYQNLKEQIVKFTDIFPHEEIRVIYLMAINYCINRINVGVAPFWKEAFDLYKYGIERKIFLENGVLSRFTYSNAIIAGLNLQDFGWVENFIHSHSQYLEERHRENFVQFYLARMHYEKKDYEKAMKLFAQSDYDDLLMTLNAKTMLLKMYFELDEYNALESLLGSMRTYLQRKKVMGYHKDNYKNIIHFTKKLLKVTPYDKAQKEKLRRELTDTNPLTERKWLLEQLDRL